ncbi:Phosphoribulokinase / Uridine kinase family protein [Trichomonas vaginalis G3]|uniref:Phosphoribulokinase / Uridine kinase family protein n=1 Tax=Trichomonas vaginalis (strain ATCC PRA-98 / G3) TaxID=412133 RepID=A2FPS3_TRIV3|nr:phosphoribulokinase family protein-related protein family [Trichomonas vaginalis G3]EAX93103.1 Phosphoribulokinase / Uridine kinase family protein [Trichomonas vaginalis G3]KAI5516620.1 phosphoribulokinase family protein-related protein family [Trichomonas vaginalis G3]|eukprot:XP_001306033.1 Phosphoribulokinase / Uridine kinase family protein [Trichomonas vaginalis G3]
MANIQYQPSLDLTEFPLEKIHDPRDEKITRTLLLSRHATSVFLLTSLYEKLFNSLLRIEHSLGDGYYFIDYHKAKINDEQISKLETELHAILQSSTPIELNTMPRDELIAYFSSKGHQDKLGVLKAWQDANIPVIKCGEFLDYVIEPVSTEKSVLDVFEIRPYNDGIILRLPTMLNPTGIKEWKDPTVLHDMFKEYGEWAKLLNVENVSKLNQAIFTGEIKDIKLVAEGLHERKLAMLAEKLVSNFDKKRVITIAGPSSSNKTTFAKRLDIQLQVAGYSSTIIEMDDYFQDGDKIPYGPDGLQDLEHISAMNVDLLAERVHKLLAGEPVPVRKYNFKRSRGEDDPKKRIFLEPGAFLIMEGIHGLNPELLQHIGTSSVTPIYVSALTPVNIDYNHRYPTSDLRLIRRIIRDNQFRGCSARKTLRRWTSVRVGEERNIFPYQGNAEMFFNSTLVYELPVLSVYARVLLSEATMPAEDEDPNTEECKDVTAEAKRLLSLINICYPLSPEIVPRNSCIREFIGGSELKY